MANAQANASAGGSPAKYEVRKSMGMGYSHKSMRKTYSNSIRSKNIKKAKKPKSHNPY